MIVTRFTDAYMCDKIKLIQVMNGSAIHYYWSAFIDMLCWKFVYLQQEINVIDIDIAMVTMHMTVPGIGWILLIARNSLWRADANIDRNKLIIQKN